MFQEVLGGFGGIPRSFGGGMNDFRESTESFKGLKGFTKLKGRSTVFQRIPEGFNSIPGGFQNVLEAAF